MQECEGDGGGGDVGTLGRGDLHERSTQTTVYREGVERGGRGEGHWGWVQR